MPAAYIREDGDRDYVLARLLHPEKRFRLRILGRFRELLVVRWGRGTGVAATDGTGEKKRTEEGWVALLVEL
jgi:hypothetical protein